MKSIILPGETPQAFTAKAWREHALREITADTYEEKERKSRLLDERKIRVFRAWKKLAQNALPQVWVDSDNEVFLADWRLNLQWVMQILVSPPDLDRQIDLANIRETEIELLKKYEKLGLGQGNQRYDALLTSLDSNEMRLLPGKLSGKHFDFNWIALSLRSLIEERSSEGNLLFKGSHHTAIADLVNAAFDSTLTPDNVRNLRAKNWSNKS